MSELYKRYSPTCKSIAFVLCNGVSDFRMTLAARGLERAGYHCEVLNEVAYWQINAYDLFVFCRPGVNMLKFIRACMDTEKPVIVDMDDDFYSIPPTNPAYPYIGRACEKGKYHEELRALFADPRLELTYASAELQARYRRGGWVIENPWDDQNQRWGSRILDDDRVRITWAGTNTHMQDFQLVLPALKSVLHEYGKAHVVIGGDYEIYRLFGEFGPTRCTYLPGVPYELYPIMLQTADMWLAPLIDNHFNQAKSDIKLVDAVAARVPWIASAVQQYSLWDDSERPTGIIVQPDGWYAALCKLMDNPTLCWQMSESANVARSFRTSTLYGAQWVSVVDQVLL